MSLFKVRDLWATSCGKDEVFTNSSLAIADLNGLGFDSIIVGSENGFLRVFNPQADSEASNESGFKPTDLLIEIQLPQPILQVSVGRLISGSKSYHIGILHPRSVAVYSLVTLGGSAEHGDQAQLFLSYEHQLKRSAYNLIIGGFGGVDGRDFMCVQSLDGTLMFFEQETLALARSLSNFLLPSPFVYVPHTDSFILLNSNWFLESYRYQVLGEESSKNLIPSWTYNLGENAINMHCVHLTTNQAAVVVVAERNLYCFKENGVLQFCKRLQYIPVCSMSYCTGQSTNVMSVIVSDTKDLMIYEQTTLKWSAQLHLAPIAIARTNFQVVSGLLAFLSEDGDLECCYLGTEPSVFVAPPVQGSVTMMPEIEAKLSTLQNEIATFMQTNENVLDQSSASRPDVKLGVKFWPMQPGDVACKVEISATAVTTIHNLHIILHLPPPVMASPNTHYIQNLVDTVEVHSLLTVEESNIIVWDMELLVVGIYLTSDATPGVIKSTSLLPIELLIDLAPPVKESSIKLSFTVSQAVILTTLFPEFSAEAWNEMGCTEISAGFNFRNNPEVRFTLTLNRNTSKYKLETENIFSLAIPTSVMARKLLAKKLETNQHSVAMKTLLEEVENNVTIRNLFRKLQGELKEGTSLLRAVERRLLGKLRDKTPTNISPLHRLISQTHDDIMSIAHSIEAAQSKLVTSGCRLGNLIKLTVILLRLSSATVKEEVADLNEALSSTLYSSEEQGWAETAEVGVSHLLRTSLARSLRDQQRVTPPQLTVTQSKKLKKYISSAVERIARPHHSDDRAVSPIFEREEEREKEANEQISTQASVFDETDEDLETLDELSPNHHW